MILREATIKYKGYSPLDLSHGSGKRICCSCNRCGRVRYIGFNQYRSLCYHCAHSGKNNYGWKGGKITLICEICGNEFVVTPCQKNRKFCSHKCANKSMIKNITLICKYCNNKYKIIPAKKDTSKFCSNKCQNRWMSENNIGNKNHNWKNGISRDRLHVLPESQCTKLNKRFINSHFHHITKSLGIYIPSELHEHIRHNLLNGKNMGEINVLAIQFINGGL